MYALGSHITDYQIDDCSCEKCTSNHKHRISISIPIGSGASSRRIFRQRKYDEMPAGHKAPGTCNYCNGADGDGKFWIVRNGGNRPPGGVCCAACHQVIKWMFEYFLDKHPLLKDLTKFGYLNGELRKKFIAAKCDQIRSQLVRKKWLLDAIGILHRDLSRELMMRVVKWSCDENRLQIVELK